MKTKYFSKVITPRTGQNRLNRRFTSRFRKNGKKSYFVLPNEVVSLYKTREISAVDVNVYAALCSLRRHYDGVQVSQKRIAAMCDLTEKTVSASVFRLYRAGLIVAVITETVKSRKKYKTSIYQLKPLPDSGYFFAPRRVFLRTRVTSKMFALYCFMCKALSSEYGKSWNSYNDICDKLGFGKSQRSEVVRLIGELTAVGLIKKTARRVKKVFVDNIYRVVGFAEAVIDKPKTMQKEKRPGVVGAQFNVLSIDNRTVSSTVIVSPLRENVKPFYKQLNIFSENIFLREGVGCDFTAHIY